MGEHNSKNGMKRRDFLKLGVVTATTAAVGMGMGKVLGAATTPSITPVYRTLGRTGLKVTIVSFGAMLTPEHEVMEAAFDMGINYVDTARRYMGGRNEEIVGRALKGRRNKVYLATKTIASSSSKKDMFSDVETSLSKLKTDYIDVIQLHNLTSKDRAFDPETREALLELRKQGKVRFFGVTSHTNQAEILNALADDPAKFFDVALVGFNFQSDSEIKQAIARAAKSGIGIVAMKTQAGGYKTDALGPISPHQAALKWVLQDTNVACAIPGMQNMSMFQEDIAVMNMKMTQADVRILDRYSEAINPYYCRLCAKCEAGCPNHVAISTINRSLMYLEGYSAHELAKVTYRGIPLDKTASQCVNCDECVARCVNGLNIAAKMRQARILLA
ncbi:MAG: putative oxidoreductase of aldo/keto reductase family [Deltaproteobacteria bacterium]|nr:putative oxidoreductase of aldo/keto reductase family [Deltaproteobacteria bacterium]